MHPRARLIEIETKNSPTQLKFPKHKPKVEQYNQCKLLLLKAKSINDLDFQHESPSYLNYYRRLNFLSTTNKIEASMKKIKISPTYRSKLHSEIKLHYRIISFSRAS